MANVHPERRVTTMLSLHRVVTPVPCNPPGDAAIFAAMSIASANR